MTRTRQVFRREGDYWTIVFEGKVVRLRNARGLHYLATLLQRPGEPVPARSLVMAAGKRAPDAPHEAAAVTPVSSAEAVRSTDLDPEVERARVTVTKGIKTALERLAAIHPSLAAHLSVTIKRGYFCAYHPDPRAPIRWSR